MSVTGEATIFIPTEADRVHIENAAKEAAGCHMRKDSEDDLIADIAERMLEKYEIPKSAFKTLAKMYHKQNKDEEEVKHEAKIDLYERIFKK